MDIKEKNEELEDQKKKSAQEEEIDDTEDSEIEELEALDNENGDEDDEDEEDDNDEEGNEDEKEDKESQETKSIFCINPKEIKIGEVPIITKKTVAIDHELQRNIKGNVLEFTSAQAALKFVMSRLSGPLKKNGNGEEHPQRRRRGRPRKTDAERHAIPKESVLAQAQEKRRRGRPSLSGKRSIYVLESFPIDGLPNIKKYKVDDIGGDLRKYRPLLGRNPKFKSAEAVLEFCRRKVKRNIRRQTKVLKAIENGSVDIVNPTTVQK